MVSPTLITQLEENFNFTLEISEIIGVILYGSYSKDEETSRSDIDICIITKSKPSLAIWNKIMEKQPAPNERYSIFFFHELPLYIKKDIFTEGKVICTRDEPALFEFFFPYRKIWTDESFIIRKNI